MSAAGTLVVKVGIVTINMAVLASPTPTLPKSLSDPLHCPQALPAAVWRLRPGCSWVSVLGASCWSPWLLQGCWADPAQVSWEGRPPYVKIRTGTIFAKGLRPDR